MRSLHREPRRMRWRDCTCRIDDIQALTSDSAVQRPRACAPGKAARSERLRNGDKSRQPTLTDRYGPSLVIDCQI